MYPNSLLATQVPAELQASTTFPHNKFCSWILHEALLASFIHRIKNAYPFQKFEQRILALQIPIEFLLSPYLFC